VEHLPTVCHLHSVGHRAVTELGCRCMQEMPPIPTCVTDRDPVIAKRPAVIGNVGPVLTLFASGGALRYCKVRLFGFGCYLTCAHIGASLR
jgi:hypothetical protein